MEIDLTKIVDPMSAATDLVVTAVCLYAFFRLRRVMGRLPYERLYLLFFVLMGLCTLFGAFLSHAFSYAFDEKGFYKLPNWICNILSVSSYTFAVIGRTDAVRTLPARRALTVAAAVETLLILAATLWKFSFLFAEIHIAVCLLLFSLPLQLRLWKDGRRKEVRLILIATAMMALVPFILIAGISFAAWFNYNDISHLVIAAALFVFYLAGLAWKEPAA